jgi:imidazoleglycerol phosphate dehydratase HisB
MTTKTWSPARSAGITEDQAIDLGNLIADFAAAGIERFGSADSFMEALKAATR